MVKANEIYNDIINQTHIKPGNEEYTILKLITNRGSIECQFYKTDIAESGVIYVGGAGGGFDTPAKVLYPYLSKKLKSTRISSLRIRFRNSQSLEEAVYDVIAGISFLNSEGINKIALVGHSFGGAVVIQAAAIFKNIKTVVTLATQSYGADSVKNFPKDTSILLIHGNDDSVLPVSCTRTIYGIAHEPKERVLLNGNGHIFNEYADKIMEIVCKWLLKELKS